MKNFETLEVGKSYQNVCNETIYITELSGHGVYPFKGSDGNIYTREGKYLVGGLPHVYDLIMKQEKPKPYRLALYGRLIQKKFVLYQIAVERGDRDRSLQIQDEIVNITERMQREENNQ